MKNGICPDCGAPLQYDDTIDEEIMDERYTATETYYCPKCGRASKGFVRRITYNLVYNYEIWEEC